LGYQEKEIFSGKPESGFHQILKEIVNYYWHKRFEAVLWFELRAYTLSHSTSPFFMMGFRDRVS
jgi:hypothetical protein